MKWNFRIQIILYHGLSGVRGDNPRVLASGLSPVQADKLYNPYQCRPCRLQNILCLTKVGVFWQGWYKLCLSNSCH